MTETMMTKIRGRKPSFAGATLTFAIAGFPEKTANKVARAHKKNVRQWGNLARRNALVAQAIEFALAKDSGFEYQPPSALSN